MATSRPRAKRPRLQCPRCGQTVSYFTYCRHLKMPFCPGSALDDDSSEPETSSDSTFYNSEPESVESQSSDFESFISAVEDDPVFSAPDKCVGSSDSDSPFEIDSSNDSAPELWPESEYNSDESGSDDEDFNEYASIKQVQTIFCLCLSFIQLCYSISDRAIVCFLTLVAALFRFLLSISPNNNAIKTFTNWFPRTLYSLRKNIKLTGTFIKYVICPLCHKLYLEQLNKEATGWKCEHIEYPDHPQLTRRRKCDGNIMKKVKIGEKVKLVPRKVYTYNSLVESLKGMFARKEFMNDCEHWRKYSNCVPDGWLTDVYDGRLWKEWLVKDGHSFLEVPGNLLLMMNVDWFRPFDHSTYSIGVIYLVIQNLPRTLRFKLENIIVVGAIPGPNEPKNTINTYLKPLVDDLIKLWKGMEVETPESLFKKTVIRAALVYVSCDIPATRKVCGFYGIRATKGCSKCFKSFKPFSTTFGSNLDYSNYDRDAWDERDHQIHGQKALEAKNARTKRARESIEHEIGARYSELLRLPYFDVVRCHMIDPMHNLLLGTAKNMMAIWKDSGVLSTSMFEKIQQQVDAINLPAGIGRVPGKIAAGFSNFTAEQWKTWTIVLSRYVLKDILPTPDLKVWCLFAEACSILCRPILHVSHVQKADDLLVKFCKQFEVLYGKEKCTPNMHLHCHLRDSVLDVGPVYSFWCFSFERYNGILEDMQKTWQAPEVQLFHKVTNLQAILNMGTLPEAPALMRDTFFALKDTKLTQAQEVIDPTVLAEHAKRLFSLPFEVCALGAAHYLPLHPIREKYLKEDERECLTGMYAAMYGQDRVLRVPLRYSEFSQMKILGQLYISAKSRSERSTTVVAVWPSVTGEVLTTRRPKVEDMRIGEIQFFFMHSPQIKMDTVESSGENSKSFDVLEVPHILAKVLWYQDHPRKLSMYQGGILLSATLFDSYTSANFIPVSRIISRCAVLDCTMTFDFGTDHVKVAIPLQKPLA